MDPRRIQIAHVLGDERALARIVLKGKIGHFPTAMPALPLTSRLPAMAGVDARAETASRAPSRRRRRRKSPVDTSARAHAFVPFGFFSFPRERLEATVEDDREHLRAA